MEKLVKELDNNIIKLKPDVRGDSELTNSAVNIACTALRCYHGDLRSKALDIAEAIVEFEDALIKVTKEAK